jgi:hypothetical protein
MGAQPAPVRFLTEIGSPATSLRERTPLTLTRLAEIFELIGAAGQQDTAKILAGLTPPDKDHIAGLWVGLALGAAARPRIGVYANNGWGDASERWLRLIGALRVLNAGQFGASLRPLLPLLVPVFSPAGFAITVPSSPLLCKLYLRPTAPAWSAVRGLATAVLGSHADEFIAGIENAFERPLEALPDHALVVSMAGSATGGALDLKLDLCGHCLTNAGIENAKLIDRLGLALGLDPIPYRDMIEDLGEFAMQVPNDMVAFVGIGGDAIGRDRINVYLTPSKVDGATAVAA